ncbi:MAG TPA: TIGR03885 family FMN-dependent LLM class oxidoreductase, partial [Longimicrobium sp.]|nr:TIGR03885 family FMN-dependent LLM class oxidoreductase [Longimicrobium sp.]
MPVRVGYHASHEQFSPRDLIRHVQAAEQAGFQSGMCSDHFYPWSEAEGESGFAWSWLGAALQATELPFGVVTVPGGTRYHPAILAQAAATLNVMFPGRFWMACGSGERLNEHVTSERWPAKDERHARLREAVDIMRALWAGETVTHRGLITVDEAKLYTRPAEPPKIIGAALSPETAEWAGGWADGLITVVGEKEGMQKIIDAFRRGGGEGKPLYLQAQLSFGKTDEDALEAAWKQWRAAMFPSPVLADLKMPAMFDAAAEYVTREDVKGKMRISADPERHLEWLLGDAELG